MRRAIRVWQRDFQVWSKYSFVSLISNLGEPILYILAIGYGLGHYVGKIAGVPYLMFLAPAVLASAVMNSASFETTFSSYTRMSVQKTFDGIIVTPVSVEEVIAGEIFWAASKSLLTGTSMFIILLLFGLVKDPWFAFIVFPIIILTGFLFASLGMLVTSLAKSYDFFAYYFTLFLGPMFFFSGTFFPLSQLPLWAVKLAWFLPLTHSVRLIRSILFAEFPPILWGDILWLMGVSAIVFIFAIKRMKKRLIS